MSKSKSRKKKAPKRVLALPDLEHAKTAVLNSLTSVSGQRTYDHAIRELVPGTVRSPASRSTAPSCSDIGFTSNNANMRRPRSIFSSPRSGGLARNAVGKGNNHLVAP
jgi:hypothetical protein